MDPGFELLGTEKQFSQNASVKQRNFAFPLSRSERNCCWEWSGRALSAVQRSISLMRECGLGMAKSADSRRMVVLRAMLRVAKATQSRPGAAASLRGAPSGMRMLL